MKPISNHGPVPLASTELTKPHYVHLPDLHNLTQTWAAVETVRVAGTFQALLEQKDQKSRVLFVEKMFFVSIF